MAEALIEAIQAGDVERAQELLDEGAPIDAQDENGWTALCWAAGAGNLEAVDLLLDRGADMTLAGPDERMPYLIALGASRVDCARRLREAADAAGVELDLPPRPYCKAYLVKDLRRFGAWEEAPEDLGDDDVVFVHDDFTVTKSMWRDEDVVFAQVSPEWQAFLTDELEFHPPDDLELIAS